ncbi:Protein wwc2 [Rhizophlyctis rosea]|uniref:Protein wwc2 n=1 Tax=Rhizophlyctis rosea TaxID=64517 RepID=A0AAD5SB15_9FUNG|nr:Protein wwc2 [Rhizophlyctis rosea]
MTDIPPPPKSKSEEYPFPEGWSRAYSKQHKKFYYIDAKTKQTSWVDPRDRIWKKKTWAECDPSTDEAPYGWEIATDPLIGTYFIDHLTQRNILDDPRTTTFTTQLQSLKSYILEASSKLSTQTETYKSTTSLLLSTQRDVEKLKKEGTASSQKLKEAEDKKERLEREVERYRLDVEGLKADVEALKALAERLEREDSSQPQPTNQTPVDQLVQQKAVQTEIETLRLKLKEEQSKKAALEAEIEDLQKQYQKNLLTGIRKEAGGGGEGGLERKERGMVKSTSFGQGMAGRAGSGGVGRDVPPLPSAKFTTRLDREMELLALKRRIEQEQREQALLTQVAAKAKNEVQVAMVMEHVNKDQFGRPVIPQWVKSLNNYANASATIRSNIKSKASTAGGDQLSFREKMLLFTSHETPLEKGVRELNLGS